ncbi:MAG: helix-turn-helix transcriptional regulator [Firmicutes bacterium]|nr:helix-turn-helix transcriptional regulator [Bacillota bacterium]
MDVKKRLEDVLKKQGWTKYRLAKECSIPPATISNIFHRGTVPTIATIEAICDTLNITLAEFFSDNEMVELTPELKAFYDGWMYLPPEKKEYLLQTLKYLN